MFGSALFGVAVAQGLDFRCGTLAFGCGALALGGQYGFDAHALLEPGACFGLGKAARLDRLRLFPEQTLGVAPQQRCRYGQCSGREAEHDDYDNQSGIHGYKISELFRFGSLSAGFLSSVMSGEARRPGGAW